MRAIWMAVVVIGGVIAGSAQELRDARTNLPVRTSIRARTNIELEAGRLNLGQPIWLKTRVTNVSTNPVDFVTSSAKLDFDLTVTDAAGRELPRTEVGKRIFRGEVSVLRSSHDRLQPGEEQQDRIDVATIYQFTQPGTYSVRAARYLTPEDWSGGLATVVEKAFSNVVQFTIVP